MRLISLKSYLFFPILSALDGHLGRKGTHREMLKAFILESLLIVLRFFCLGQLIFFISQYTSISWVAPDFVCLVNLHLSLNLASVGTRNIGICPQRVTFWSHCLLFFQLLHLVHILAFASRHLPFHLKLTFYCCWRSKYYNHCPMMKSLVY